MRRLEEMSWILAAALAVSVSPPAAGQAGRGRCWMGGDARGPAALSFEKSSLFLGSGFCTPCHQSDGYALSRNNKDISPVTQWRSTLMAHSARDPLWRAAVSAEVAENPSLRKKIEDKCTRCHAPMGHAQARKDGAKRYSMQRMERDSLSTEGVGCTVCHQIQNCNFAEESSFSGGYHFHEAREILGPYPQPLTGPMVNHTGYTPVHSPHMDQSELCATCHTLFTPTIDADGKVAGTFPEQTPYLEWKNSDLRAEGISCQQCHMNRSETPIDIASRPPWHAALRSPYWEHGFVGGNTLVPRLLGRLSDPGATSAPRVELRQTADRAARLLRGKAVKLSARNTFRDGALLVTVKLENLTGHKLPTGIPLRRMWLHVKIRNTEGKTVFESGGFNDGGEIAGLDRDYEPHHDVISRNDQVQVYEAIMADSSGRVTRTLMRAARYAKDNRIPPRGFTTRHADYAACAISGRALRDADFNGKRGDAGTGTDTVTYSIALARESYRVDVEVLYQTVSPRFLARLASLSTPETKRFGRLLKPAGLQPVLLATVRMDTGG